MSDAYIQAGNPPTLVADTQPFPEIPFDIFELIITIAAGRYVSTALALSLVSKEVQEWSDKELFVWLPRFGSKMRVLDIISLLCDPAPSPRLSRARKYVQVIALLSLPKDKEEIVHAILSFLPNTRSLALWGKHLPEDASRYHCQPLQRLTCYPTKSQEARGPDFASPLFANLSHLDLVGMKSSTWSLWDWRTVSDMRFLTHLSLDGDGIDESHQLQEQLEKLVPLMPSSLYVLIFVISQDHYGGSFCEDLRLGKIDDRIVPCLTPSLLACIPGILKGAIWSAYDHWCGGYEEISGEHTYWEQAYSIVSARRQAHNSSP